MVNFALEAPLFEAGADRVALSEGGQWDAAEADGANQANVINGGKNDLRRNLWPSSVLGEAAP